MTFNQPKHQAKVCHCQPMEISECGIYCKEVGRYPRAKINSGTKQTGNEVLLCLLSRCPVYSCPELESKMHWPH